MRKIGVILLCVLPHLLPMAMGQFNQDIPRDLPVYSLDNFAEDSVKPVYTPLKELPQQEVKKPDTAAMERLHGSVERFVNKNSPLNLYDGLSKDPAIANLIAQMKEANRAGISHDDMVDYSLHMHDGFFSGGSLRTAVIFLCLKRYNLSTRNAPEDLGVINKPMISYEKLSQLPHYLKLIDSIVVTLTLTDENIEILTSWLRKDDVAFKGYDSGAHENFSQAFYDQGYKLLFSKNLDEYRNALGFPFTRSSAFEEKSNNLYRALQMFENALQTTSWETLDNLVSEMLKNKTETGETQKNLLESLILKFDELSMVETKEASKRIAVLYQLIRRYFEAKKDKINPTYAQFLIFWMCELINPSLTDAKLRASIDTDTYAIQEWRNLRQDLTALMLKSDKEVEQQLREFNVLYIYP